MNLTPQALHRAIPPHHGTVPCAGLSAPVRIFRDAWGIAHVRAEGEADAWFGQGFATAQDRLWQMDFDRRRAAGRWAEVVGPEGLESDLLMRRFRLARRAEELLAGLTEPARAMLERYAAGVNAFIASGQPPGIEFELTGLPPEPWRPADSLAVFGVRHILMGTWDAKLWRARLLAFLGPEATAAFYPGYAQGQRVIVPPDGFYDGPVLDACETLAEMLTHLTFLKHGSEDGSNNWVVGGAATASGQPLLAGDPHRALDVPNVYYPQQLACPDFDAIGYAFPGVPGFPHFAHTTEVAWGITHGHADIQDLFVERFASPETGGTPRERNGPARYEHEGAWLEVAPVRETVAVKGAEPVTVDTWETVNGPLLMGGPERGWGLSFRYTALEVPNGTLDTVREMLFADTADALEEALRGWVDPVNNLVYFDRTGQFGYRTRGALPVRHAANAFGPVPGWSGEHGWRDRVPFEGMPAVRNPACGFAYSANNRIAAADYPHYIAHDYAPGFRAERIAATLSEGIGKGGALTVDDMASLQGDMVSVPAAAFRGLYGRIVPADAACEKALALLRGWDGVSAPEAAAPALFAALRKHLVLGMLRPRLEGRLLTELLAAVERGAQAFFNRLQARLHELIAANDTALLPAGESWETLLSRALSGAVADLTALLGPDMDHWRWDAIHTTEAAHPLSVAFPQAAPLLDPPPLAMGGDGDTVQAAGYHAALDYRARSISVARYIFDGGDWERSRWIVPGGASGHPGSSHYADQLPLYHAHQYIPMLYAWARVEAEARAVQVLEPA